MDSEVLSENRGLQRWCVMVRAVGVRRGLCGVVVSVLLVLSLGGCWHLPTTSEIIASVEQQRAIEDEQEKDDNIAFLRRYENEMIAYVKTINTNITSVSFDWDTTKSKTLDNGLPWGGAKVVEVHGMVNNDKHYDFWIAVQRDIVRSDIVFERNIYLMSSPQDLVKIGK